MNGSYGTWLREKWLSLINGSAIDAAVKILYGVY